MTTVKTTMNIEKDLLKELKIMAINGDTTQTETINNILKRGLMENETVEEKLKRLTINNPTKKLDMEDVIGILKTDSPIDPVKALKESRNRKFDL
ncbi:MAG: hypothetical protein ACRC1M_08290 [Methanobacteriaceae archaeon]